MYELKLPEPEGQITADRSLAYNQEDPDTFKILTYWGYSPVTDKYYAIESTWRFVEQEEKIHLHLEEVKLKYPRVAWFTVEGDHAGSLSDVHLRMAREQYRIRSKKGRCDNLNFTPSGVWHGNEDGSR